MPFIQFCLIYPALTTNTLSIHPSHFQNSQVHPILVDNGEILGGAFIANVTSIQRNMILLLITLCEEVIFLAPFLAPLKPMVKCKFKCKGISTIH